MQTSLATDVLLLAIGDRATFRTKGPVGPVVAGAGICEEVLAGSPVPATSRRQLVQQLTSSSGPYVDRVASHLRTAGVLEPHAHKVLGLFPRHGYRLLDPAAQSAAANRLRAALTPGSTAPAAATLAVLCATSGIARAHLGTPPRHARRAVADHLNGLAAVVGPDVCEVLHAVRQAYRRHGSGDSSTSFASRDGYGDEGGGGDGGGDGGGGGD